ncbi:XPG domain containing-domain-containing protein [Aspergillus undulatus]|uniref:XPG domain containing-domain-containing protein n=1 Tax=Aspergillus undulatus TaxID=1810928 RepID=UPI003CCDC249
MGIPRLRRHLLPFNRTVLLQGGTDPEYETLDCIESVVIDGPSLVYNVYSRLLSWFSVNDINLIDALPTCDEVSRGVVIYLMQLRMLGVKIEEIYFDGALPVPKRETRIARLESQRKSLEVFCAQTKNGFEVSRPCRSERSIEPENVLRSRPTPARYDHVPANPFMVSAVFEDLKERWNWRNISNIISVASILHPSEHENFPWADITTMVPGEADAYCAHTARLMNSCILTNDSDLLLFDIGAHGSVIFLDSVELTRSDPAQPLRAQIKAASLCPFLAARRLGIPNLLSFAYELEAHPTSGMVELLQRSKNTATMTDLSHYHRFINCYQIEHCHVQVDKTNPAPKVLDSRISELFWQYELQGKYATGDEPHVYLPILNEDHTKQCAWVKGRGYRSIAYSILNLSRPPNQRHRYVHEYVRRGQRIAKDTIELQGETWISAEIMSIEVHMDTLQASLRKINDPRDFWRILALCECYGAGVEFTPGDLQKLKQFLELGYLGKQLRWADIHLTAQIQAVLYSLRVLKQLLNPSHLTATQLRTTLRSLPPLHQMMRPARQNAGSRITTARLSDAFACLAQKKNQLRDSTSTNRALDKSRNLSHAGTHVSDTAPSHSSNMYELLQG